MIAQLLSDFIHDGLSVFFVSIILLVSVPVFIYSKGYMQEYWAKENDGTMKNRRKQYFYGMMLLFVAAMLGVVLSRDGITFMVFWELMSISSFFLVIFDYKEKDTIASGIMYFIMTHISGLLLMVMFALLYKYTASFHFNMIAARSASFLPAQKLLVFTFALLGFGAKAGMIPLHAWLPKAHPAAPSNISALMSGVMLKVALYGFILTIFVLLHSLPAICGTLVLVIGTATAFYSITNAIYQNNIKKLLAFSSAENIGLILATIGLAMVLSGRSLMDLSLLALTAALFHILNHAVFKGLLFMSAGSVVFATGTKNMNLLGGLHSKMPFAAGCAFIGTAAISAMPPLNGFASEVMILKSFMSAGNAVQSFILIVLILGSGIILALTSGGAIYAAVKSFGITYLGAPRSEQAEHPHPLPKTMHTGMGILAAAAVLLGVLSPIAVKMIAKVSAYVLNTGNTLTGDAVAYDITIIAVVVAVLAHVFYKLNQRLVSDKAVEINDTWGCGFNRGRSFMQYSGSGYIQPASRISGVLVGYRKESDVKESVYLKQKVYDILEKYLYKPTVNLFNTISGYVTKIHQGAIQVYVSYIFITLIVTAIIVINFV